MKLVKCHYPYKDMPTANSLVLPLFKEMCSSLVNPIYPPLYCLTDDHIVEPDGTIYLSLKKLYLEEDDPSEADFAQKWFSGWKHWEGVSNHQAMTKYVREWRAIVESKTQQAAIQQIKKLAASGNFAAAKWLAEKEWRAVDPRHKILKTKSKGKPSKNPQDKLGARFGGTASNADIDRVVSMLARKADQKKSEKSA